MIYVDFVVLYKLLYFFVVNIIILLNLLVKKLIILYFGLVYDHGYVLYTYLIQYIYNGKF